MLLKPEVVAKELDLSIYTVKEWLREGKIKGVKLGKMWRISEEELERLKKGE